MYEATGSRMTRVYSKRVLELMNHDVSNVGQAHTSHLLNKKILRKSKYEHNQLKKASID